MLIQILLILIVLLLIFRPVERFVNPPVNIAQKYLTAKKLWNNIEEWPDGNKKIYYIGSCPLKNGWGHAYRSKIKNNNKLTLLCIPHDGIYKEKKLNSKIKPVKLKYNKPDSYKKFDINDIIKDYDDKVNLSKLSNYPDKSIGSVPITDFVTLGTNLENECISKYNSNYGVQLVEKAGDFHRALCSRTYRNKRSIISDQPTHTYCLPKPMDSGDVRGYENIENICKILYPGSKLVGLDNKYCIQPLFTKGVCGF
jgi:hypothetical protein